MRFLLTLALVAVPSCTALYQVGPVLFKTPCGLQVHGYLTDGGLPAQWNVGTVSESEGRLLAALGAHTRDPRLQPVPVACARLRGWHVYPYPTPTMDQAGAPAGFTNCDKRLLVAGEGDPRVWTLPHELVHALQRCDPWDHTGWVDAGVYRALDAMGAQ